MNNYRELHSLFRRRADAVAFIDGSEEYRTVHGRVMFYGLRSGVIVRAEIVGLPKGTGKCDSPIFAFHIHDGDSCTGNESDPFASAGSHYNPYECPHPYHAGDLPPLFGAGGNAIMIFLTDRFTVDEIIGRTVIIHSSTDDFTTQPAGNAGIKIACGVITSTAR